MAIIVEWQRPYTWGTGVEIDWNKVISVLLREENNLILVNNDNELYTDLQLADWIQPDDNLPVWVTVWKVLEDDWWTHNGLLLNWKTTSWDYARWIYWADGKIYFDWGTGTWTQVYYSSEVDALFTALRNELATVAFTGDYNDLRNRPTIPVVYDGTLTIQKNWTKVWDFTANQQADESINITVPVNTSDLNNDSGFIDNTDLQTALADYTPTANLAPVALSNDYDDLTDKPTIWDATITIQKNWTQVNTFTTNATSNKTINITMNKSDVGLWNVDNTSDLNKPISTATQTALDWKQATISDLATIRSNASAGKSASDTIATYWDIVTHDVSEFATATQWWKADTAVQPWDLATVATSWSYADLSNKPTIPSVIDNVTSSSTTDALSANQGKVLQDQIDDLKALWKFLSLWDASTWLPISFPESTPYTYSTWDYYLVETIASGTWTNYRPSGSSYTGTASTTAETDELEIWDMYIYDWQIWLLQINHGKTVSFANLSWQPSDNANLATALNAKADTSSLATVATSGSYADLSNKPTIPTVNNATLTIQKNWTTVKTFTANASSNVTANITVPTKTSDITNDSGFLTSSDLSGYQTTANMKTDLTSPDNSTYPTTKAVSDALANTGNGDMLKSTYDPNNVWANAFDYTNFINTPNLATVATSGSYSDLSNKPTIPTVNNATLTITQNGTSKWTFTANASSNATIALTDTTYSRWTPASWWTTLSLVNTGDMYTWNNKQDTISDLSTIRTWAWKGATAVQPWDLATVATTGSYSDLSNKPTIPSVNNTTITFTQWGVSKGDISLNQSSAETIALDAGFTPWWTATTGYVVTKTAGGYEWKAPSGWSTTTTCTLTSAWWSSKSQTVSVSGVTASNTVIVSPAPSGLNDYASNSVYCESQASWTLTFKCNTVPSGDISVNILILS